MKQRVDTYPPSKPVYTSNFKQRIKTKTIQFPKFTLAPLLYFPVPPTTRCYILTHDAHRCRIMSKKSDKSLGAYYTHHRARPNQISRVRVSYFHLLSPRKFMALRVRRPKFSGASDRPICVRVCSEERKTARTCMYICMYTCDVHIYTETRKRARVHTHHTLDLEIKMWVRRASSVFAHTRTGHSWVDLIFPVRIFNVCVCRWYNNPMRRAYRRAEGR